MNPEWKATKHSPFIYELSSKGTVKVKIAGETMQTLTPQQAANLAAFILNHSYPWTTEAWVGDPMND